MPRSALGRGAAAVLLMVPVLTSATPVRAAEPAAAPRPAAVRADPLSRAYAAFRAGRYAEASRILRRLRGAALEPAAREAVLYLLGEVYYRLMDRDLKVYGGLCAETCEEAARAFPKSPLASKALFHAAEAELRRKRHHKALYLYEKIAKDYAGTDAAWRAGLAKARTLATLRRYDEAVKALGDMPSTGVPPAIADEVRMERVRILREIGRTREALSDLSDLDRKELLARPGLATEKVRLLAAAGRTAEARDLVGALVEAHPGHASMPLWLALAGAMEAEMGRRREALELYYRARKRAAPGSEAAVTARAGILDLRARPGDRASVERALSGYDALLKETAGGPYHARVLLRKISLLARVGRDSRALELLADSRDELAVGPWAEDARAAAVRLLTRQALGAEAPEACARAVAWAERFPKARGELAAAAAARLLGCYERAGFVRTGLQRVAADPRLRRICRDDPAAALSLAALYVDAGKAEQAKRILPGLVTAAPPVRRRAYTLLARLALDAGEFGRAVRYARLALVGARGARSVRPLYVLGWSEWKRGRTARALEAFARLLDVPSGGLDPGERVLVRTAAWAAAEAAYALGRYDRAERLYAEALKRYGEDAAQDRWARYRLARLALRRGAAAYAARWLEKIPAAEAGDVLALPLEDLREQAAAGSAEP